MRGRILPLLGILLILIVSGAMVYTYLSGTQESAIDAELSDTQTAVEQQPTTPPASQGETQKMKELDLTVDSHGLSRSTVVITTDKGVIKYKFYSEDAPQTVKRIAELIQQGFYNGLIFHRVVPKFVIQGGDPQGNGTGGSGQKLQAEFNKRKHIEGTVAMARAADPNSADSQFYISLGEHPHLDNSYTVFGQVTEGMDVVKKIQMGDKMVSVTIE